MQMNEVYRCARKVIAWLGPMDDLTLRFLDSMILKRRPPWWNEDADHEGHAIANPSKAMNLRKDFVETDPIGGNCHQSLRRWELHVLELVRSTSGVPYLQEPNDLDFLRGLDAIQGRDWWYRLWIILEFVLALNIELRCRSYVIDPEEIAFQMISSLAFQASTRKAARNPCLRELGILEGSRQTA